MKALMPVGDLVAVEAVAALLERSEKQKILMTGIQNRMIRKM